jgi:hypothetical protein
MGDASVASGQNGLGDGNGKKHILLNAFDMSTVGHLSPGQWKVGLVIDSAQVIEPMTDRSTESQRQVCDQANTRVLDRAGEATGAWWYQRFIPGGYNWRV